MALSLAMRRTFPLGLLVAQFCMVPSLPARGAGSYEEGQRSTGSIGSALAGVVERDAREQGELSYGGSQQSPPYRSPRQLPAYLTSQQPPPYISLRQPSPHLSPQQQPQQLPTSQPPKKQGMSGRTKKILVFTAIFGGILVIGLYSASQTR